MNTPINLHKLTVFSQLLVEINFQTLDAEHKIIKAAGEEDLRTMLLNRYPLKLNTEAKPSKIYYSPQGYWKEFAAVKKLATTANVSEEVAKRWLAKQALWQIYLPAPRYIPRPKFDVSLPQCSASSRPSFFALRQLPAWKKGLQIRFDSC